MATTRKTTAPKTDTSTGKVDHQPLSGVAVVSQGDFERAQEEHTGQTRAIALAAIREKNVAARHALAGLEAKSALNAATTAHGLARNDLAYAQHAEVISQDTASLGNLRAMGAIAVQGHQLMQQRGTGRLTHERSMFEVEKLAYSAKISAAKNSLDSLVSDARAIAGEVIDV